MDWPCPGGTQDCLGFPATPDDEPIGEGPGGTPLPDVDDDLTGPHRPGSPVQASGCPATPWWGGNLRATGFAVFVGGGRAPAIDADASLRGEVDGLLPEELHAPVIHSLDRLYACLCAPTTSVRIDVRIVINPTGRTLSVDSNAPDRACMRDALARIAFPRRDSPTFARFRLEYTVKTTQPVRLP
ncbi:MAG TPA: hypothetical protein VFV99_08695 [Kofleriaceae bacterium]|nr:hypothetical protein [Kofleriaceae bacterium]